MKKNFKAVRRAVLVAVLAIVGAVGGASTRGYLLRERSDADTPSTAATVDVTSGDVPLSDDSGTSESDDLRLSPDGSSWEPLAERLNASQGGPDTQATANALLHGDLLIQEGRVSEAVRYYRYLLSEASSDNSVKDVRYRLALCAEALGRHGDALSNYQQVVQVSSTGLLGELAWLGQARVLAKQKQLTTSQQLLRRWLLLDNDALTGSLPVLREALYLLGSVSSEIALSEQRIPLWDPHGVAFPRVGFDPCNYLPALFSAAARDGIDIPVGIQMLQQLQVSEPGTSYFQGRLARSSIHRVLQQLCEAPHWTIEFSSVAENSLRSQTVQLNFSEKSADLLFDLLLAPLGMAWTFESGCVRVVALSEMTEEDARRYQRTLAERMLFAALLAAPEHELSPMAYLLLGNLSFQIPDLPSARRHYDHVLQNNPRAPVAAEAWFNSAKIAIAEGQLQRARQSLLGAVDVSRGSSLEPVALLLSGHNELLFEEPVRAIRPLVRAVTLAADQDVRALSLLSLASAHLLAGQPQSANLVLVEDRRLLQQPAYRDRAAFLGSLARFRSATTPWRTDRDGRALIAALSHIREEDWNTLPDLLLNVEALDEVGLADLAVSLLDSAVQSYGPSPLRTRMQFQLADRLIQRGDPQRAEVVLTAMTEHTATDVAMKSQLALAHLHVKQRDGERAEQCCRELLQQTLSEEQRVQVLRLLGGIYAGRGDRERAVLCFSGVAPQLFEATLRPSATGENTPSPSGHDVRPNVPSGNAEGRP
ncbi:MAG: tetratricopeptide repeat protein [Planctomycetaceae bacterium]|nr:tetratricopeptide repeat protein [Planctomycetaceae bacterium]